MSSDFMRNFLAGWSMGQQRTDQQQQDEMMRRQAEQEAYRRQQDEIENQMRREHWNIQKKQAELEMKKAEFDAKAQAASMMSRDQQVLPPETQDLGGATPAAPSTGVLNLGELIQQRAPIMAEIPGAPEAGPVPLPFREDIQALKEAESQRKMREALGMLQAQEGIRAQFRQPERPVSVAPGGTLVDPSTGRAIYHAPKPQPEPGEMSPKQTQNYLTITNKFQADPIMSAAGNAHQASLLADEAIKDPSNVTNQLTTLYLLVKNLDPTSAVREGELGLAQSTQSYWQKFQSSWARVSEGQIIAPAAAKELAEATKRVVKLWEERGSNRIKQYRSQAKGAGVGDAFEEYLKGAGIGTTTAQPTTTDGGWQTVAGVRVRKKVL